MTKKHYILLAKVLAWCKPTSNSLGHADRLNQWNTIVEKLTEVLAKNNHLFDKKRFKEACGVE